MALTGFRGSSRPSPVDPPGAAAGCGLVILALDATDGPTTVIATALIACAASACFLTAADGLRLRAAALVAVTVCSAFVAVNSLRIMDQASLLRVEWVKGVRQPRPLFEKWNSFSQITVNGDPTRLTPPQGWGLSPTYPTNRWVHQRWLLIDGAAGTLLTRFDGRLETVEHLKARRDERAPLAAAQRAASVVGTGGGRDVLSALAFGQREVVGRRDQRRVLDVRQRVFRLVHRPPRPRPPRDFVNDEARSYLTRQRRHFDILQISLIDTWSGHGRGRLRAERALAVHPRGVGALPRPVSPRTACCRCSLLLRPATDEIYRATVTRRRRPRAAWRRPGP